MLYPYLKSHLISLVDEVVFAYLINQFIAVISSGLWQLDSKMGLGLKRF